MPQFARPSTDTGNAGWTNDAGSPSNLWQSIDDPVAPAGDSDFIRSSFNPPNDIYITKLSAITDPGIHTGHVVRFRGQTFRGSGNTQKCDLQVSLHENYVSELDQGVLIAFATFRLDDDAFGEETLTLSAAEASNITNYGNLFLRFEAVEVTA